MKKILRYGMLALMILGLVISAVGCGSNEASDKKVLKVGTNAAFAPFEYTDDEGNIVGFDADLIKVIGEEMGYEVELSHMEWDGLDPALESGQVDVVIAGVTITEERKLVNEFSQPYFEATQIIAVRDDSNAGGMEDLAGLKVGVQASTTGEFVCEDAGIPSDLVTKYPTLADALMNLLNGSIDAVVGDAPVVMNYMAHNPEAKLKLVEGDFDVEYYGIKVKKGNTELMEQIDAALVKVQENGKFDEVFNKYFKK